MRAYEVESCVVFQAEDGIRDLVRSRGLGDVYKRQLEERDELVPRVVSHELIIADTACASGCLLYTSDAAAERSSEDLGAPRLIKKKHTMGTPRATITPYPPHTLRYGT